MQRGLEFEWGPNTVRANKNGGKETESRTPGVIPRGGEENSGTFDLDPALSIRSWGKRKESFGENGERTLPTDQGKRGESTRGNHVLGT